MQSDGNRVLIESIRRLLRRGATSHLGKIINKTHAADLSIVFRSLSHPQRQTLFTMIQDAEQKGILLTELDEDTAVELIEDLDIKSVVEILEVMPNDDVADLLGRLPEETSQTILEKMKNDESDEVEDLLRY